MTSSLSMDILANPGVGVPGTLQELTPDQGRVDGNRMYGAFKSELGHDGSRAISRYRGTTYLRRRRKSKRSNGQAVQ